jgi:hypothetical protein
MLSCVQARAGVLVYTGSNLPARYNVCFLLTLMVSRHDGPPGVRYGRSADGDCSDRIMITVMHLSSSITLADR